MRPWRGPTACQCTSKNAARFSDCQPGIITAPRVWCRHCTSILGPGSRAQQCKQESLWIKFLLLLLMLFAKFKCFAPARKNERHLCCAAEQNKPCEPGWYWWQRKQLCEGNSAKRGRNQIRGVISPSLHQTQTEPRFREKPNPPMWPCLVSFCFSKCARTCCSLNTTCWPSLCNWNKVPLRRPPSCSVLSASQKNTRSIRTCIFSQRLGDNHHPCLTMACMYVCPAIEFKDLDTFAAFSFFILQSVFTKTWDNDNKSASM